MSRNAGDPDALRARFDLARLYAWVGGLSMLLLVFLTPPFQVPDEPVHFFRSYQLSRLEVLATVQDDAAGSVMPASLPELVQHFMGTLEPHTTRVVAKRHLADTLGELRRPLDAGRTTFVDFSGAASYAPLPFIPQALAIGLGRSLDVGPLGLLYMARAANVLVAVLVTALALALFPAGGVFAFFVALLPMTQFMTASVSPDALTIASALLFTAVVARFLVDGAWSWRRQLAFFAAGLMMCVIKVVYMPLLVAGLAAVFVRGGLSDLRIRRGLLLQFAAIAAILAITAFWFWATPRGGKPGNANVDGARQLAFLAQDPVRAVLIVLDSLADRAVFLGKSMVGILGWLNLAMPQWVYVVAALGAPLALCADRRAARLPAAAVAWLPLLALAAVFLVEIALYLGFTPVGSPIVQGVQGRYFTPVLPAFGVAFAGLVAYLAPEILARRAFAGVLVVLGIAIVAMHATLVRGYGLL